MYKTIPQELAELRSVLKLVLHDNPALLEFIDFKSDKIKEENLRLKKYINDLKSKLGEREAYIRILRPDIKKLKKKIRLALSNNPEEKKALKIILGK
jgi:hypothetical protein